MSQPIREIIIVGGGTAGWITAGTIAAKLNRAHHNPPRITLVESPNVPIIGVGEGTWPTMRRSLQAMGVNETEFIRQCNVSFKQGAKFCGWVTGAVDDGYYHPLVLPKDFEQTNLAEHWLSLQAMHNKVPDFANSVCSQGALCEHGLAPKLISTPEYDSVANYAYHLDAGKFSKFLQHHCVEQLNVQHIYADVEVVDSHLNGDIKSLTTKKGQTIEGDFFIDCTGFKSLLIGEHFKIPFKSCQDILFNDKAIAVQVPYPDKNSPIASHTISTAQTSGWIWDIGLANRRGVGHVYASDYISDVQAHQQLLDYLNLTEAQAADLTFRPITFKPGHRQKFWHKNCVAVGLSAGFLEPLEASALLLVEISASFIAQQLPAVKEPMDVIANRFNRLFLYRWQSIIDFLKLHYLLSKRRDSQYWIDNQNPKFIPDSLQQMLSLWRYQSPWHEDFPYAQEVFPAASYQYVLYGMGFHTQANPSGLSLHSQQQALQWMQKNAMETKQLVAQMPSNRTLLNAIAQQQLAKI
ncbi:tryptophan 7-halogenase [Thalassotalea litorea]|uniref:Tryptophan 7-halogenase n=1 Tax=Thalassotalea litorea TaxID=2020715 RepID=A0A5R9ILG8_9GAMM|nr:tryptophan halogenase family protein [Thalassotalea litorea]TLU66385.1 tryptophan 7-halogenase [Thalassotalea litorea]